MSVRHLRSLFRPKSIALIAAGTASRSIGGVLARNLFAGGFDGPIMPVHAERRAVQGVFAWASVGDLPVAPDLALIAQPAAEVPVLIEALGVRGARAAVVLSTDADRQGREAGAALRREMLAAARPFDLRIVGPACLGVVLPEIGVNASYAQTGAAAGDLAFISQSGTLMSAMLEWARPRGVGFSLLASLGDTIDVDFGDILDHLTFDAETRAVLLCIERIKEAREFISAARAIAQVKPVIVLKVGRLALEMPPPRAGAPPVADADAVYEAAFRRAGLLSVPFIDDLVAAAQTLASRTRVSGSRLAVVANGRGGALVAMDELRRRGGRPAVLAPETVAALDAVLPAGWGGGNPVNVFADASAERYEQAVAALLADAGSDALLVVNGPTALGDAAEAATAVAAAKRGKDKPVFAVWVGEGARDDSRPTFAAARVADHARPEDAVSAFLHLVAFRRNQEMLMETPPSVPDLFERDAAAARAIIEGALAAGRSVLTDAEAAAVLEAYGLEQCLAAGAPLRMAIALDDQFGPVIQCLAAAAPMTTAAAPATVALPPLNLNLAGHVLADVGITRAAADDGAALALVRLSQLACDQAGVTAVTIDPPGPDAAGGGVCRIWVRPPAGDAEARLAIRPYPVELEKTIHRRDGQALLLRPIRPEDEPALQEFNRRLDPEDVRMRFFSLIRELDHRFAARLTQLDYDRQMAFVAVDPVSAVTDIAGVVRITADPSASHAEYAVIVRSDLKGQGLGRRLMEEIIAYCRQRGIAEVWGQVLAQNRGMLGLVRKLGFTASIDPDDPAVMQVRLALRP